MASTPSASIKWGFLKSHYMVTRRLLDSWDYGLLDTTMDLHWDLGGLASDL